MLNLENIKKARELLSIEIQKLDMSSLKEYSLICESAGALDVVISRLRKDGKKSKKSYSTKS